MRTVNLLIPDISFTLTLPHVELLRTTFVKDMPQGLQIIRYSISCIQHPASASPVLLRREDSLAAQWGNASKWQLNNTAGNKGCWSALGL